MSAELLNKHEAFMASWKEKGNPTAKYSCAACGAEIEIARPKSREETWDSARSCPHCEAVQFITVDGRGKVEASALIPVERAS